MNRKRHRSRVAPALACACAVVAMIATTAATTAAAHDIVIFPEWQDGAVRVDVRYGHPQDYHPIVADKLFRFTAFEPGAGEESWRARLSMGGDDLKANVVPTWNRDAGVLLLAGQFDNGYWTKVGDDEFVNTSRANNPKAAAASHNLKYAKALLATGASHAGFDRVVGHRLEIVPMADPLALHVGDTLPVQVRFKGKPLANVGVEIGDSVTAIPEDRIPRFRTDASGRARVPIGKAGWQVVGVDYEERSPLRMLADKEKYTATLVFRLP